MSSNSNLEQSSISKNSSLTDLTATKAQTKKDGDGKVKKGNEFFLISDKECILNRSERSIMFALWNQVAKNNVLTCTY